MTTTMDIAHKMVALCREHKNEEALRTLFASDMVSVEAGGPPGMDRTSHGVEAVIAKGQWWVNNHDIHSATITGPWPHDDRFIVGFEYDVTFKPEGRRFVMSEAALYTVKDGKIVREEFFYAMG